LRASVAALATAVKPRRGRFAIFEAQPSPEGSTGVDGRAFESTGRSDRTDELSRFIADHDQRNQGLATAAPRSRPARALVRRRASRFEHSRRRTVVSGDDRRRSRSISLEEKIRFAFAAVGRSSLRSRDSLAAEF
jgi:hypothetical protein